MSPRKSQSQNSRATFREQIQNHPIIVVIGACVAVAVAIVGVIQFFHKQDIKQITAKYEQENAELRKRIVSIERIIGGKKYFDITEFLSKMEIYPKRLFSFQKISFTRFQMTLNGNMRKLRRKILTVIFMVPRTSILERWKGYQGREQV